MRPPASPPDRIAADSAGFVLAGGQSRRMGRDKALVEFDGQPLIARAIATLTSAGFSVAIAGARSPLESYAPVVPDIHPGMGPLGGICAALRSTAAIHAVFLPVDLPLLPASLILYLLHYAQATRQAIALSSVAGFAQTFPAVLDRTALPFLEHEFASGRLGCLAAFQAAAAQLRQSVSVLPVELLVQSGQVWHPEGIPPTRWFHSANTPSDLVFLNRL